jgi:hypothetical protein
MVDVGEDDSLVAGDSGDVNVRGVGVPFLVDARLVALLLMEEFLLFLLPLLSLFLSLLSLAYEHFVM